MGPVNKNIAELIIAKNNILNFIWVAFYSQKLSIFIMQDIFENTNLAKITFEDCTMHMSS